MSELDHPVFTSLDFITIIILQNKVISLASNPQPRRVGVCIYVLQVPGSLFVAFYDSQGYSGSILTHLHMGCIYHTLKKKWEYNKTEHQLFIDLKKACDSVAREV
jgi:hypothetical protein